MSGHPEANTPGGSGSPVVSIENRLTPEQLAALTAGDEVAIESSTGVGRPRTTTGTIVRVGGSHIVVKVRNGRGFYAERFRLRDGARVGGLTRAELVNPQTSGAVVQEARRRFQPVDNAYREWARNRADVDKLRQLQTAIGACLQEAVNDNAGLQGGPGG